MNPVVYTEISTSDPARARAFYTELFGWTAEPEEATPSGPYTMFGGLLLGMREARGELPVGLLPYIAVDDIRHTTDRARQLGGTVLRDCIDIPEGVFSIVRDPTGAVLGLWHGKH